MTMNQPPSADFMPHFWFFPILLFVGISVVLSVLSGWTGLAKNFKSQTAPEGERFRFVSGSIGVRLFPVNYGGCLFITVNDAGFGLSVFFLFRLFSPALFIPWDEVESMESKRFLFFFRYTVITLRNHWPVLSFRGKAGEYIRNRYMQRQNPMASTSPFRKT